MNHEHRLYGQAPTTWEAGLLKIRAFEMILILFYIEDLRRLIIDSIEGTDQWYGVNRLTDGKPKIKAGKKLELARSVLVSEGIIDQDESDELKSLVNYRNVIGHTIHHLTVDVGAYSDQIRLHSDILKPTPLYDYTAAKRAKALRQKVSKGMMAKFMMKVSFDSLAFEAAEKTYIAEIERLKQQVNQAIVKANKAIAETSRIMNAIPESVMALAQPGHPRHFNKNGTLSKRGAKCVFQLFEAQATPLAVAYLMRISHRSATHWFAKWKTSRA